MTTTKGDRKNRGDLQLIALGILNASKEDYTFDELTKAVGDACFPDHPEAEPKARHLVRYLVKNQDRKVLGKNFTLRQQGRVVAPAWYKPVAVDPNCPRDESIKDGGELYKAHMAAVAEIASGVRPKDEVTYLDFPLKSPTIRKKPTRAEQSTQPVVPETRGTPERLNLLKEVAKNFKARTATERMKEMAQAGAAAFASPTVTSKEPTTTATSELEGEGI